MLRVIENRFSNFHAARTVKLDEHMSCVQFTNPSIIAVNAISVSNTFVLQLGAPCRLISQ